jgi:hypothetical protein
MSETQNDQNDGIKQDRIYKIEDTIKDGWKRVRRFVNDHPTISASAATAVISWKISKRHTLNKFGEDVSKVAEMIYELGSETGTLKVERDILLDFIHTNDLNDEVREFVSSLR